MNLIQRMDWGFLREQKDYCLNEAANNKDAEHIYDGLVHLIDAIQDEAVSSGEFSEEDVFGEEAEMEYCDDEDEYLA